MRNHWVPVPLAWGEWKKRDEFMSVIDLWELCGIVFVETLNLIDSDCSSEPVRPIPPERLCQT